MGNKRIMIITISILIIVIAIVGTTYAYFTATVSGNENATSVIVQTGGLSLTYTNGQEITGEDILPGWSETKTFTVENTGTEEISFYINLVEVTNTFVGNDLVYTLTDEDDNVVINESTMPKYNASLTNIESIEANETLTFKLTITFKDTVNNQESDMGKEFMGKIEIDIEEIIVTTTQLIVDGGMYLEYDINMIPVAFNPSSGATVKADITNTDSTYKWYDYNAKRWANAVLVTDANRELYKESSPGTPILEEDILGYFVYIPRYSYQLFNVNSTSLVQTIKVEIENKNTPKSNGTTNGTWLTHPAFTFGETELNGIWVGKFENSPEEGNTCYMSSNTTNCNITTINPRVKPNKNSWRFINVSNMFVTSRYFKINPIYGITESEIDSHMMKNMEWGAIAYLTQSRYGKNGEVYINNYALAAASYYNTLTGCSSGTTDANKATTCAYAYPNMTANGTGASTTGTIYGIYDMSGGSYEYVMGNIVDAIGVFNPSDSGFASTWGASNSKYYDSYAYGTTYLGATRGKLGDSTRETLTCTNSGNCSWNSDHSYFPSSSSAWFIRGGNADYEAQVGMFAFSQRPGGATDSLYSSRVVFAIESTD